MLSEVEQGLWEGPINESLEPRRRPLEEVTPQPTVDANNALRKGANRVSLVLRDRQRLLVWGDVEKAEIKSVESDLWRQRLDRFATATAPHHGRRWPERLGYPRALRLLESRRPEQRRRMKTRWRSCGRPSNE